MAKNKESGTATSPEEKRKLLDALIAKEFGEHAFTGDDEKSLDIERIKFGIPNIDYVLGGGIPKGRYIELFGQESAGKTTLALQMMQRVQAAVPDGNVVIIDLEHALHKSYMFDGLGLDPKRTRIVQPDDLVAGCNLLGRYAESGLYAGIVFDSTAAKVKDKTGDVNYSGNDSGMGREALALNQMFPKAQSAIAKHGIVVPVISQVRSKIGVVFGNPNVTTGGNAPKYYASIRLEMAIKEKTDTWNKVLLKAIKNKTADPYRTCEAWVEFGKGFDRNKNIFEYGIELGVITNSGAWFYYKGEQIAQGREKAFQFVMENPGILDEIESMQ